MKAVVERLATSDAPADSPADRPVRGAGRLLVTGVEIAGGQTRLQGCWRGRDVVVTLPVVPDERRAQHLKAAMRHIHRVKLAVAPSSRVSCTVDAVGHRLPLTRRIPITIALGLGLLGVPLVLSVTES